MKEKQLVILGNLKMNMDKETLIPYFKQLKKYTREKAIVGVAVPNVYLSMAKHCLGGHHVLYGAQDCSPYEKGAYTGSVSATMLADFDCDFCLVGHSECRQRGDSDEDIAGKVDRLQENGIKIVLCVGESLEQRQQGTYLEFVKNQLLAVIKHIDVDKFDQLIIAYEPIWAIGTGMIPTSEQIAEMAMMIKKLIADYVLSPTSLPYILYGGSVNAGNIDKIVSIPSVDGVLVGGACLKMDEFEKIIQTKIEL